MKLTYTAVIAATGLALLAGCATPTPYQPALNHATGSYNPGYSETRLEDGRYRLSFAGNDLTKRETVENYLLYRAAELTLTDGYDWFEIVSRGTDEKKRVITSYDDPFAGSLYWRFYGRNRWSVWSMGMDDFDRNSTEYTRYEASAEVLMHKGAKPDDKNAYDAKSVKANLESKIVRPIEKK
jgi:hypothetical protein